MPDLAPHCVLPDAFALMRRAMTAPPFDHESLLDAAIAPSIHLEVGEPRGAVRDSLQDAAKTVRARCRSRSVVALMAYLHEHVFDELGWIGCDAKDHDAPRQSLVACAVKTRESQPAVLAILYHYVARELGLSTRGIGMPGRFFVGVDEGRELPTIVDVADKGRILGFVEATRLCRDVHGRPFDADLSLLSPATNRQWVSRIMHNLRPSVARLRGGGDTAAMLELELLMWPDRIELHRDLGHHLARQARFGPAAHHLSYYLGRAEPSPETAKAGELVAAIRRQFAVARAAAA